MTAGPAVARTAVCRNQVAELMQTLVKALRAFQMYLPNNPIYQRAAQNVKSAFTPIWGAVDELVLSVAETDFRWEEEVVYSQPNKGECLAWGLFKDGMRALTIRRGAEEEELTRFSRAGQPGAVSRRGCGRRPAHPALGAGIPVHPLRFIDFFGEGGGRRGGVGPGGRRRQRRRSAKERTPQVEEESPPRPKGVVDLEDFDSTLYFLDEAEINSSRAS